jgi:two-component system phosphate regulon sensor histidine kinase PhoR
MSAFWLRTLLAPALVLILGAFAGAIAGAAAALVVVVGGLLAVIAWHVYQLHTLLRWASGPIDGQVPEGRGAWALMYAALYQRVRLRTARRRDLRLALDRFVSGAEALPEGVVVLDSNDRIQWANPRAETHLGIELRRESTFVANSRGKMPRFQN